MALLSDTLRGGGAERVMAILANEFAQRGIAVDLLLVRPEGTFLDQISPAVRVVPLGASRIATSVWPLVRYLHQTRPQCLLSTLTAVNLAAVAAHRIARSPARLVLREANTLSNAARKSGLLKERLVPQLARPAYKLADRVVAVSAGVANDLHEIWSIPNEKIFVIYNPLIGPELRRLAAEPAPHAWMEERDYPLILGVGRLTQQKNFPMLLRALAMLQEQIPARLLLLGEGEDRNQLEKLSRELGIDTQVAMPGFAQNPFAYMARATVFVLCSSWEGLPGVLIQALACGCPVVSTDCPHGPREILDDGRIGRLVPVDDPEALCAALAAAIRGELQPAAPEWLAQFSTAAVVQRYLQVMGVEAG